MPKMKTHSGAAKRFKNTATGKIKRGHSMKRQILTSKATKRKRQIDTDTLVDKANQNSSARMITYACPELAAWCGIRRASSDHDGQQRVKRLFWAPLPARDRDGERGRSPCLQPLSNLQKGAPCLALNVVPSAARAAKKY